MVREVSSSIVWDLGRTHVRASPVTSDPGSVIGDTSQFPGMSVMVTTAALVDSAGPILVEVIRAMLISLWLVLLCRS